MEYKIYYVEPRDSNFYELDDKGKVIEPNIPISTISRPYYAVRGEVNGVRYNEPHTAFETIFKTFDEAREFREVMKGSGEEGKIQWTL